MQTRTNSVTFLAALMIIGGLKTLRRAPADDRSVDRPFANGISSTGDNAAHRIQMFVATAAWGQCLAVLPAGSGIRMAPAPASPIDPFRLPVRSGSPLPGRQVDQAKLDRTMGQLQSLMQAAQLELHEASKGQLPRDLIPHLKRIEKLSKQLRREIAP